MKQPDVTLVRWGWLIVAFNLGPLPLLLFYPYFEGKYAWGFVCLSALGIAFGLYAKYRSALASAHLLVQLPLGLVMLGLPLIGCVVALLVVVLHRNDLVPLAIALTCLSLAASSMWGAWRASTLVKAESANAAPAWLRERVNLDKGAFVEATSTRKVVPWWGSFALATAFNLPLLSEAIGLQPHSLSYLLMVVLVPVMVGVICHLAAITGANMVYLRQIIKLEQRQGRRFTATHLDEVRALRREFWFAKWLCRPEDLAQPPSTPTPTAATRRVRRRLEAARKP